MNYVYKDGYGVVVSYHHQIVSINTSLTSFISMLCLQNFNTYEGATSAAKALLKTTHKLPIYISDEILLFPTHSIRHFDVVYINYYKILLIHGINNNQTKIIFKNGEKFVSKQSLSKINLQLLKTKKLLENRKNHQLKVFTMMAKQ